MLSVEDGALSDINARLTKARFAFCNLQNIWKSNKYSLSLKMKIYNSNVKSILLYGAETWRVVQRDINVFHSKHLRKICKIFWPNKISNIELQQRTKSKVVEDKIKIKRWKWLGYVLRMDNDKISDGDPFISRKRIFIHISWGLNSIFFLLTFFLSVFQISKKNFFLRTSSEYLTRYGQGSIFKIHFQGSVEITDPCLYFLRRYG